MASWLQNQLKAAEGLLEAVDRSAKTKRERVGPIPNGVATAPPDVGAGSTGTDTAGGRATRAAAGAVAGAAGRDDHALSRSDSGSKAKLEREGSGSLRRQKSSSEKKVTKINKITRTPSRRAPETDSRAAIPSSQPLVVSRNETDAQQPTAATLGAQPAVQTEQEAIAEVSPITTAVPPDTARTGDNSSVQPLAADDVQNTPALAEPEPELQPSPLAAASDVELETPEEDVRPVAGPEAQEVSSSPPATAPVPAADDYPAAIPFAISTAQEDRNDSQPAQPAEKEVGPLDSASDGGEEEAPLDNHRQPAASSLKGKEDRGEPSVAGIASRQQDLEEAKAAVTSGASSREARLQRVCDKLKARLEELKEENTQLEDLLAQADQRASGGAGEVGRLQKELKKAVADGKQETASHRAILDAKEAELNKAQAELERQRTQIETLESKLANLEETTEELLRERQSSEGRVITALRDQLAVVEQRLDEERVAHSFSRKTASTRHEELEAEVSESASALTSLQRTLNDRTARVAELEDQLAAADEELDGTLSKLRRAEETAAREKARADANSAGELEAEVAAWKEEAEKERRIIRDLEEAKAGLERDKARLAKKIEDLEEVASNAQSAADSDLSKRFKEVTDLLYLKQTQLEKMAAEKAAQQLGMEREVTELREELAKSKRRASSVRDPIETYATEMTPMDHMGAAYQRLANDATLGSAVKGFAKAVDVTAANAMRILRNYPLARVIFFVYSILIHLFVYILIQRLQSRYLMVDEGEPDHSKPMNMQP